ncbi:uncharacterized protein [Triticum aestivum]|nr:uncharacterized protein LOC123165601 isoform X2 [Triticum aestivum]
MDPAADDGRSPSPVTDPDDGDGGSDKPPTRVEVVGKAAMEPSPSPPDSTVSDDQVALSSPPGTPALDPEDGGGSDDLTRAVSLLSLAEAGLTLTAPAPWIRPPTVTKGEQADAREVPRHPHPGRAHHRGGRLHCRGTLRGPGQALPPRPAPPRHRPQGHARLRPAQPGHGCHGSDQPKTPMRSPVNKDAQEESVTIAVADEHMGAVIGRGGRIINEISKVSGAWIDISGKGEFIPGTRDR